MIVRIIIIGIALFFSGCVNDAPRDNPLDPLSGSYSGKGHLSGRVTVANQSIGVAGAVIARTGSSMFTVSDSAGYFVFNDLAAGMHRFVCTAKDFTADTFDIEIRAEQTTNIIRGLNSAPLILSSSILTYKIDQYFPSPQYFVDVAAEVTDPNSIAELDSVWFAVDSLRFPLTYSVSTKKFITTIYKYQFPTNTIQWLVGKPLRIIARDSKHAIGTGEVFYVTRVIENTATPAYPSSFNNDTTGTTPVFKWLPPDVTFNFSYSLFLARADGGVLTQIWSTSGINSFFEEYAYPGSGSGPVLTAGNYSWSVSVVDDFGNVARSKESSFVIK
jgi:hypothetical protein